MAIPTVSDTIHLDDPHAGNANAGNGGDGYNYGNIDYSPSAYVANTQSVYGADVDVHNGDHVADWATWDAGFAGNGGEAEAENGFLSRITNNGDGGDGGNANSNGDLGSVSGGDVAAVHADTGATQNTTLLADQHATILAGMGGNGGDGNMARGGDISSAVVHSDPTTTTDTTTNTIADSFNFSHVDIDLSHLPV
jgi:hypothetical protein